MVHFLLVSGDDKTLELWQMTVGARLLIQERREHTVFYTCMDTDFEFAKTTAESLPVTLQEINRSPELMAAPGELAAEQYEVLVEKSEHRWPAPE